MKIQIIGNGSFGTFFKDFLSGHFEIVDEADVVILAIPISAYDEVAQQHRGKVIVNVCSVQSEANEIIAKYTKRGVGLHPLFGARTPKDISNYNCIETYGDLDDDTVFTFIYKMGKITNISSMTDIEHDKLMAKTHGASMMLAKQAKHVVDGVGDIPDKFVPNSFKLLRKFVETLEDMPAGTVEGILSNPYIEDNENI
jgi:prephenate dehydrogenase|tara:strand:- start:10486 stop:11079 length:594 start_codon:yes stop_codon:yes gene_type:complete